MRTPAGKECQYFYADYYRGRDKEECRLLSSSNPPIPWKRELCLSCPVPEIILANACPFMILQPSLKRSFFKQSVRVNAYCTKTSRHVKEPHIGCGVCHPISYTLSGDNHELNATP